MERALEQFLDESAYARGLAPLTCEAYASDLRDLLAFLRSARRRTDWPEVVSGDLVAYLERLRRRGYADATLLRRTAAIRRFFAWLLESGRLKTLPTETLVNGKRPFRLPKTIAEDDLAARIEAIQGDAPADVRDRAILEVLYGCGLRCAELCALRLHDCDFAARRLRIRGKGSKERVVPFGPPAAEALVRYLALRERFVLTWKKGALAADLLAPSAPLFLSPTARPLNRRYLSALVRSRVRPFLPEGNRATPHTLRHAFATHLLAHGAPLLDIRDLLGHASISTTQIYTHLTDQRLRSVFDACFPRAQRSPKP